jgi:hypothetical protein
MEFKASVKSVEIGITGHILSIGFILLYQRFLIPHQMASWGQIHPLASKVLLRRI